MAPVLMMALTRTSSLQYIKFDDVVAMVTKLGRSALMAKFDVQSAFRNLAVLPSQWYQVARQIFC